MKADEIRKKTTEQEFFNYLTNEMGFSVCKKYMEEARKSRFYTPYISSMGTMGYIYSNELEETF